MSTRKKLVLFNAAMLVGLFISIFIAPPETPVWLWATISAIVIAVTNYALLRRQKAAINGRTVGIENRIVVMFGAAVLVLDVLFRFLRR